ncbi:hypothetical protein [Clostridium aminobutyricum]|uniref:PCI domain-containing protein n=1 Tax=Clostridium aminobutyricum TaxID=33953 RepID=A0A939DB33_CLOAM|nr:hypothetical protein [Clostridium aminobutyricum]MBN7774337.1 hypothetical protein [Clostridium aminobutyricum]
MYYSQEPLKTNAIIGRIQLILGGLIILFFGSILVSFIVNGEDATIDAYILLSIIIYLGIRLSKAGYKRAELIKVFKNYMNKLPEKSIYSMDDLANELGDSPEVIKENLQMMMEKRFFSENLKGAYINKEKNTLIFPNFIEEEYEDDEESESDDNPDEEFRVLNCPNCGGINRVKIGRTQECEFCGSSIN